MNSKVESIFNKLVELNINEQFSCNSSSDINCEFYENEGYIEFKDKNRINAVLLEGDRWKEVKQELGRQKLMKDQQTLIMQEQSKLDNLTNLYNKEYSKKLIEDYLLNSQDGICHALMIVDIENFKQINDNLGYLFGQTVLVNIANSLKDIFYEDDIAARIGGDKFLIFLKNTSCCELLQKKANEIYSVFLNTYTGENKDFKLSCNIGIAIYPTDGKTFMELFENAHSAMIYSKRTDCTTFYQGIPKDLVGNVKDCFDLYKIEITNAYGNSKFDKEITAFAFDIMSRTKDVNSAINILLNKVRNQFKCSHICIIEKSINNATFRITHLGSKEGILTLDNLENTEEQLDELQKLNILNLSMNANKFDERGIFAINDTTLEDSKESELIRASNIKSLLQCGIFEDNNFKGCVSFDDCENPRNWTQYEIDSFITITRVISSYLLKLRASETANQKLYQLKNIDSVTGLATLHKFKKDTIKIIENNTDKVYTIIYSDINRFKYINDSLGYDVGDSILCDYSAHLTNHLKENELVARIAQDNFIMLIQDNDEEKIRTRIATMNEKFSFQQKAKYPGIKIVFISGAVEIKNHDDITVAIDNANIARKSVKDSLKTVCKFFDISMQKKLQKEAEIINSMEKALKNGEFLVYLQPKIKLDDNKLVGAEALVRWKRETGMMPPDEFIPIFEKNGFIINMDFYIYEEVCKILRSWIDHGYKVIPISVNVSRVHLNDENFVSEFNELVERYKIPHDLLEIEITESILLTNIEIASMIIKNLRNLNYKVSIDDFGAGYSSLNILKEITSDVLKLDKEFFSHDEMKAEEKIIISNIISMAKQLNMTVLSEGIETQMQSDFLKSVSCDMAQGYLYSKPIPVADFEKNVALTY